MYAKQSEQKSSTQAAAIAGSGPAALAKLAAPARAELNAVNGLSSFPAQFKHVSNHPTVAQRSTVGAEMPGLHEQEKKDLGKNPRDEKDNELEKRETRGSKKKKMPVDLNRPKFTFSASKEGVGTQKLNKAQDIGFRQQAKLTRPANAVNAVTTLYDFRQEVCDAFHYSKPEVFDKALDDFDQDGPYQPDYDDDVIETSASQIIFNDNPGFSTNVKIGIGDWLDAYEVHFRWTVSRADEESGTWTSPEVVNSMVCDYDEGKDVQITYQPANAVNTEVVIPNA